MKKVVGIIALILLSFCTAAAASDISLIEGAEARWLADSPTEPGFIRLKFGDDTVLIHEDSVRIPGAKLLAEDLPRDELFIVRDRRPMREREGYETIYSHAGFRVARIREPQRLRIAAEAAPTAFRAAPQSPMNERDVQILPVAGDAEIVSRPQSREIVPDSVVESVLAGLDEGEYEDYLRALSVDLPTRFACAAEHMDARDLIAQHFSDLGLQNGTPKFFLPCVFCDHTAGFNVVAVKEGLTRPEDVYLVGGHYDSRSEDPCNIAPGSNDNASGAAAVMELARLFSGIDTEATIAFAAFDGEEFGMLGSFALTQMLAKQGMLGRIKGMLALDMISYYDADYATYYEGSDQSAAQAELLQQMVDFTSAYTELSAETSTIYWGSDHVPFLSRGIPGAMAAELNWDSYAPYHTSDDVIDYQDIPYAMQIVRATAAALLTWAVVLPGDDDADDAADDTDDDSGDDTAFQDDDSTTDDDSSDNSGCGC